VLSLAKAYYDGVDGIENSTSVLAFVGDVSVLMHERVAS
jgi:hypothetical protein